MNQPVTPKTIVIYANEDDNEPFTRWLKGLKDPTTSRRILRRLTRVEAGNYGDYKSLKEGLYELRLDFGPGYRVYFGEDADVIVVLLCGGDKSTQASDIALARKYWKEYQDNA